MAYRTRQEIFTLAWNGLKAQGFERSGDDNACLYRGPDGRKCAIGHCIPDDKYDPELEGRSASAVGVRGAARFSKEQFNFVDELQSCHDEGRTPRLMEQMLRDFAANNSLLVPT